MKVLEAYLKGKRVSILAASSGGGHWEELMLLKPAFEGRQVHYVTTDSKIAEYHGVYSASVVIDCNQNQPLKSIVCLIMAIRVILKVRPEVVISTGAAPGFFCIFAGRLLGARTLWIDSFANGEELSMCGRLSKSVAHECWTQWDHLSLGTRPAYRGSIL